MKSSLQQRTGHHEKNKHVFLLPLLKHPVLPEAATGGAL